METIFVQIASYKDPELPKTLADCLKKAKYPERLRFGICWQKDDPESLGAYPEDRRFRIHTMNWKDAKGVGYARSICNGLYQYEDFTLQIDSHHRFAQDWDELLIEQWKACNHPKAVLSGYPPGYVYNALGKEVCNHLPPMTMVVKGFDCGYIPTFKTWHVANEKNLKGPFKGCFMAAGFMFTIGQVCTEVPYVKEVYFTGEEILQSMRLFTFGYRIFYPNKWLIWHLYERRDQQRHWDDFTQKQELKPGFNAIQDASLKLLQKALMGSEEYRHLFGSTNTIAQFEAYSGVSIKQKVIHPRMLKGFEPPFAVTNNWEDKAKPFKSFKVDFVVNVKDIPDRDDYTFWYFGLHDNSCTEIVRDDVRNADGTEFKKKEVHYKATHMMREAPTKYIIWPHSKEKGWHERLVFNLPNGAVIPE